MIFEFCTSTDYLHIGLIVSRIWITFIDIRLMKKKQKFSQKINLYQSAVLVFTQGRARTALVTHRLRTLSLLQNSGEQWQDMLVITSATNHLYNWTTMQQRQKYTPLALGSLNKTITENNFTVMYM